MNGINRIALSFFTDHFVFLIFIMAHTDGQMLSRWKYGELVERSGWRASVCLNVTILVAQANLESV